MPAVLSKHACRGRDDDNGASAGRSQTSGDGSGREQQDCAWQAQELSSDGGGWKALRLHTGAILKPDAELVHKESGARRPLYRPARRLSRHLLGDLFGRASTIVTGDVTSRMEPSVCRS